MGILQELMEGNQEHITAKLMGIDIASLGKGTNAALTPLQAHSRYLPIGGKIQNADVRI
jgi:hypothetical protein